MDQANTTENMTASWKQLLMVDHRPQGDAATMETVVLAHRAEQLGIVVSDRTINNFLKRITQDVVTAPEIAQIIARMKNVSQAAVFDALRRELLASRLSTMFQLTLGGMPPAQRWDYFEDLNLKADAQVLPVPVEPFLKDIPDPPADKLLAFFERFQNQLEEPNSSLPGFKQPPKAAFQYFKANVDTFVARAAEKLTPEEVHEYYETNKAQFKALVLPSKKSESDVQPDDEKPADSNPDDAGAETPATDAGEVPPAGNAVPPASNAVPPAAQPKGPAPAAPKAAPPKNAAPGGKKSSSLEPAAGAGRFRLTAAPKNAKPAAAKPAQAPPASAPPTTAPAAPGAEQPATDPAAEQPAEGSAADDHVHAAGDDHGDGKKDEPAYEPFEKVEKQIRKTLSEQKANTMIEEALRRLSTKMREYGSARRSYEANKQDDPDLVPPAPLDFEALAKEEGVEAKETELVTAYEAETETDIGKSFTFAPDRRSQFGFRKVPFFAIGFSEQLYHPESTDDDENNRYLWWKIKSTPEIVPELADVRGKVVRAYKMIEARELAMKKAEEYAKEARAAKKPLKEVFAGREGVEVTDTGAFTRMTMGNLAFDFESSEPRLSPVHGVEAAGTDFMDAVFKSSDGQTQTALNVPQTVAYVVQLEHFSPERRQLEHEFLIEPFEKYRQLAVDDERQLFVTWLDSVDRLEGLDWLEQPRTETRSEE